MKNFNFTTGENVLFVGEGNFTFSYSVIDYYKQIGCTDFTKLFVTCLEDEQHSIIPTEIKNDFIRLGVRLVFGIDATKMSKHMILGDVLFNKIIFNFPHIGGKMKIHLNRKLLQDFFVETVSMLSCNGEVIVTLCAGQGGTPADIVKRKWEDSWQIVEMAARGNLVLKSTKYFPHKLFNTYISTGYRGGTKRFHTENAVIHFFGLEVAPLLTNLDEIIQSNATTTAVEGVRMPHAYTIKLHQNPLLNPNTPQSWFVKILEDVCRKLVGHVPLTTEAPLFTKLEYPNQVPCVTSGGTCYLRKNLLHVIPKKKNQTAHFIIKGLSFNKFDDDFTTAPAECRVAIFGPKSGAISTSFINYLTYIFQSYLQDITKKECILIEQNWFQLKDTLRNGVDFNIDQILTNVFDINWRQLWSPGLTLETKCVRPELRPPSLYFHSFRLDVTFKSMNGALDVSKLFNLVQIINCDMIIACVLLNVYQPDMDKPRKNFCFRFVYQSFYSALSKKKAVDYHCLVSKAIEHLLQLEIV